MGPRWSVRARRIGAGLLCAFACDWIPAVVYGVAHEGRQRYSHLCSPRDITALALLRAFATLFALAIKSLRGSMRTLVFIVHAIASIVLVIKAALVLQDVIMRSKKQECTRMQQYALLTYCAAEIVIGWVEASLLDALHRQRLRDEGAMLGVSHDASSPLLCFAAEPHSVPYSKVRRAVPNASATPAAVNACAVDSENEDEDVNFATPPENSLSSNDSISLLDEAEQGTSTCKSNASGCTVGFVPFIALSILSILKAEKRWHGYALTWFYVIGNWMQRSNDAMPEQMTSTEIISSCRVLQQLPWSLCKLLLQDLQLLRVHAGKAIARCGTDVDCLYIIVHGSVTKHTLNTPSNANPEDYDTKASVYGAYGKVACVLDRLCVFGSEALWSETAQFNATFVAREPVTLLVLQRRSVQAILAFGDQFTAPAEQSNDDSALSRQHVKNGTSARMFVRQTSQSTRTRHGESRVDAELLESLGSPLDERSERAIQHGQASLRLLAPLRFVRDAMLRELACRVQARRVCDGQIIARQGMQCEELLFISSGSVSLHSLPEDAHLPPPSATVLGDFGSLEESYGSCHMLCYAGTAVGQEMIPDRSWSGTAIAREPCTMISLHRDAYTASLDALAQTTELNDPIARLRSMSLSDVMGSVRKAQSHKTEHDMNVLRSIAHTVPFLRRHRRVQLDYMVKSFDTINLTKDQAAPQLVSDSNGGLVVVLHGCCAVSTSTSLLSKIIFEGDSIGERLLESSSNAGRKQAAIGQLVALEDTDLLHLSRSAYCDACRQAEREESSIKISTLRKASPTCTLSRNRQIALASKMVDENCAQGHEVARRGMLLSVACLIAHGEIGCWRSEMAYKRGDPPIKVKRSYDLFGASAAIKMSKAREPDRGVSSEYHAVVRSAKARLFTINISELLKLTRNGSLLEIAQQEPSDGSTDEPMIEEEHQSHDGAWISQSASHELDRGSLPLSVQSNPADVSERSDNRSVHSANAVIPTTESSLRPINARSETPTHAGETGSPKQRYEGDANEKQAARDQRRGAITAEPRAETPLHLNDANGAHPRSLPPLEQSKKSLARRLGVDLDDKDRDLHFLFDEQKRARDWRRPAEHAGELNKASKRRDRAEHETLPPLPMEERARGMNLWAQWFLSSLAWRSENENGPPATTSRRTPPVS